MPQKALAGIFCNPLDYNFSLQQKACLGFILPGQDHYEAFFQLPNVT